MQTSMQLLVNSCTTAASTSVASTKLSLFARSPFARQTAFRLFANPTSALAASRRTSTGLYRQHSMSAHEDPNCIFCKIIKGAIPSFKLVDTEKTFAFLDIGPLAKGHALVIPKYHGEKLTDIPDDHLSEVLRYCKAIAKASGFDNYNVLQNNGRLAHQEVPHVHFHVIPKNNEQDGLGVSWPAQKADMEELKKYHSDLQGKLKL